MVCNYKAAVCTQISALAGSCCFWISIGRLSFNFVKHDLIVGMQLITYNKVPPTFTEFFSVHTKNQNIHV